MPKSLVQTLDELVTLGPDEIVAAISDPLDRMFDMFDMTSELWAKNEDRQVHWFRWRNGWESDTSGHDGERLGNSYHGDWVDRVRGPEPVWYIISNEAYHKNGLPPEPPR